MHQLFREAPILEFVKTQKPWWAGHMIRMDEHRQPKRAFNTCMQGKIPTRKLSNTVKT